MSWIVWLTVGSLIIGLLTLIVFRVDQKRLSQKDLTNVFCVLCTTLGNGALVRIEVPRTKLWFSVKQIEGGDSQATLELRVPRLLTSYVDAKLIRERISLSGLPWHELENNISLLATVMFRITDISNPVAYSKVALAARDLLKLLGIPPSQTINIRYMMGNG